MGCTDIEDIARSLQMNAYYELHDGNMTQALNSEAAFVLKVKAGPEQTLISGAEPELSDAPDDAGNLMNGAEHKPILRAVDTADLDEPSRSEEDRAAPERLLMSGGGT
ncbi:hypothetical protein NDU88_006156 [Pleurodeles waltl]|uniref:Uncharacterized protein n=1 Tax=Pleurodeles waltl TaxID=8319 RepID=A0AAV7SNP5_PLEWA|nr:hypothetical protein NDU88_006156 [Pleurodeles waltl]